MCFLLSPGLDSRPKEKVDCVEVSTRPAAALAFFALSALISIAAEVLASPPMPVAACRVSLRDLKEVALWREMKA